MKTYRIFALFAVLSTAPCGGVLTAEQPEDLARALPTTWSQYGFRATHSSFNNAERLLSRGNVANLMWQWAGEVGMSITSAPVVGRQIVYVAADGMIFAFRASDGTPLWSRLSCSGVGTVQAAVGPRALLVGDGGGDLAAYDPTTGDQIWCDDESGSITSAPALDENAAYITNGMDVVALDPLTGRPHWRFTPADFSPVTNTPAVRNGVVCVTGGHSVFALDKATGHLLWRANLGAQSNLSAPSVALDTVYVGGNALYALRASDGHLRWKNTMAGVNVSMPATAYNKVFVNSEDPNFGLWAFNASTGAFVWRTKTVGESEATVTVANGVVFDIAESGELMLFNSDTGALLGSLVDPDGHPFALVFREQPSVVNGTVYVPTSDFFGPNRVDAFRLP